MSSADIDNITLGMDATCHKREKIMVSQLVIPETLPDGRTITTNYCISADQTPASDAEVVFGYIQSVIRKLAVVNCPDVNSAEMMDTSLINILKVIRFWCTDGGSEMAPACKYFVEWQKSLGLKGVVNLKCNAHFVIGLESEADKIFCLLGSKTDAQKYVSNHITAKFIDKSSRSMYYVASYAILQLLGKSADSVSYSLTSEFTTFIEKEKNSHNIFIDVKKARFGKLFLIGRDLAFLLFDVKEFLSTHAKDNNLYEACQNYLNNFPYLLEHCITLGILHYHIVHPYMLASGIDGEVYPLSHTEFYKLIPNLKEDFEKLSVDSSPLLKKERFGAFLDFKDKDVYKLSVLDKLVYNTIFNTINEGTLINADLIMGLCKAMCLKFIQCLERQLGELYLGENCTIKKAMEDNPEGLKTAAVNNLGCERRAAQYKYLSNKYTAAKSSFISRKMINPKAPIISELSKLSDDEFKKELDWARHSPQVKKLRQIEEQELIQREKLEKDKLKSAREQLLLTAKKRAENAIKCQTLHSGPLTKIEDIENLERTLDTEKLEQSINAELKFQKENVRILPKDDIKYRLSSFIKVDGKNKKQNVPLHDKIRNLKTLISMSSFTLDSPVLVSSTTPDAALYIDKLDEICKIYQNAHDNVPNSNEEILCQYSVGKIAAFLFVYSTDGVDVPEWSLGEIRSCTLKNKCPKCKGENQNHELNGICMKVKFLDENSDDKTKFIYSKRNKLWHCTHEQVIMNNVNVINKDELGSENYYLTPHEAENINTLMREIELI